MQHERFPATYQCPTVLYLLELGAGRCYLADMLRWIRQRRTLIASLLMVALLPLLATVGPSLVWCISADGHSAIETTHQPHAGHAAHDVSAALGEHCADIAWGVPATVLRSASAATADPSPARACWFGSDSAALTAPSTCAERRADPPVGGDVDRLAHRPEHLSTVILRV